MLLKENSFQNVTFSARIHKSTKSCRRLTFFNKNVRVLHLLWHLMWLRWLNFLVYGLSVYIWLGFALVFHMLFVYSMKKNQWLKFEKRILPTYLFYFFEHLTASAVPSAIPRLIFMLLNQYGRSKMNRNSLTFHQFCLTLISLITVHSS